MGATHSAENVVLGLQRNILDVLLAPEAGLLEAQSRVSEHP